MQVDVCEHNYSNNITNKKIIVFGPVPPPYGGVAVHIERVIAKLKKQSNTVIQFSSTLEYRYRFLLLYLLRIFFLIFWQQPDIILYHTPYLSNSLKELEVLRFCKTFLNFNYVVIDHNCRHMYIRLKKWKAELQKILRSVNQLICIGDKTYASYLENLKAITCPIICEAAFVPPDTKKEQEVFAKYSPKIKDLLHKHSPILLATSWRIPELHNDLYGFDICLETVEQLKAEFKHIGLLYIVSQKLSVEKEQQLQAELEKRDIVEHVLVVCNKIELWPLFKKVDVFIRPTRSDGASVSVAESCYFGTPTIASDVCVRPDGVHLFKMGDAKDCVRVVRGVLSRNSNEQQSLKTKSQKLLEY